MSLHRWPVSMRPERQVRNAQYRQRKTCPILEVLEDRKLLSTFWVSNTSDSGAGSLRQAVLDANHNLGADTIRFKHAAEGTITLASQLTVTGDTTIKGPGADDLTVSGGGTTRVLDIAAGATVSIEKLTIANGFVVGDEGGGILNEGTLTLRDSIVTGNQSVGSEVYPYSGGEGGGILNVGTLAVDDSTIKGNYATYFGGGISNGSYFRGSSGQLTVVDSLVTENNVPFGDGGGIKNYFGGTASIQNSVVSKNTASFDGAGIRSDRGTTLTIADSTLSENESGLFGTGGLASGASLTIQDSVISGNIGAAAGIYLLGSGDALISHSTITDNVPSNTFGFAVGGIWSSSTGKTRIEDSTISDNVGGFVGGVYNGSNGLLEVVRSTISGNRATPTGQVAAAGVYGAVQIDDSTISGNTVMADQLLVGFVPSVAGGVFSTASSSITHSTIAFNSVVNAPTGSGSFSGGVLVRPGAGLTISNTIVARNSANVGDQDVNGTFASGGHNLVGILTGSATGFLASDLSGTATTPLDPRLKALGWYGGPTQTHALDKDSPAIDAGDNTNAPPTDQRGSQRIFHGTIDIGAYESRFNGSDGNEAVHALEGNDGGLDSRRPEIVWHNTDSGENQSTVDVALDTTEVRGKRRTKTAPGENARYSSWLARS